MSNELKIDEIIALKKKVNELVKSIQTLKNRLARSQITLEEFKKSKAAIEELLRNALKKIAQYKETIPAKSVKKVHPPTGEAVQLEETTQIEAPTQEIQPREMQPQEIPPKETPTVKFPPRKITEPAKVKELREIPSREIVVKEIPPKEKPSEEKIFTTEERVKRIEDYASRIKKKLQIAKKPLITEKKVTVRERVKLIEAKPHVKKRLKKYGLVVDAKDAVDTVDTVKPTEIAEPIETTESNKTARYIKRESQIAEEANDLMFYYQTDFDNLITKAIVYLSITANYHFTIEIDFTNYPKRPKLKIPSKIIELFIENDGDVFENVPTLFDWDDDDPGRIYQVIAEIEYVLMKTYRTKTDKPEKVPLEINLIPEKLLEKISGIIPTLQKIWHFLVIIIMIGVLSLGMAGVNPFIPIIAFTAMIGIVYLNGNLEIDFSPESFNSETAPLEGQELANYNQEIIPRLTRTSAEMFHEIINRAGKRKSNRGHNLQVGMVDGDTGRTIARGSRRARKAR